MMIVYDGLGLMSAVSFCQSPSSLGRTDALSWPAGYSGREPGGGHFRRLSGRDHLDFTSRLVHMTITLNAP